MDQAEIDRLKADIERLKGDLEDLTRSAADDARRTVKKGVRKAKAAIDDATDDAEEEYYGLRARAEAGIADLRSQAEGLEEQLLDRVREKPIQSLAIAAGVGFLFAMISGR